MEIKSLDLTQVRSFSVENDEGTFRIRYRDVSGKMKRLSPKLHPSFDSLDKAKVWISSREAFIAGEKARRSTIKENAKKYSSLNLKIENFVEFKKNETSEWKTVDCYFRIYVIPFFCKRGLDAPEMWPSVYDEFLEHLRTVISVKTKDTLKTETKRKICFWFNNFLTWLYRTKQTITLIDGITPPEIEDNELSFDKSYWTEVELEAVKPYMPEDYFELLIFGIETMMRISEILSIRNSVFRKGNIAIVSTHKILIKSGINYTGYIRLMSQLVINNGTEFVLGPLKGYKKILEKHSRFIPITDKADVIVKKYYNKILSKGNLPELSTESLFWPNITIQKFNEVLTNALEKANLPRRTSHSMRHTGITNFLNITGSENLVKSVSGHKTDKSFKRYNHLVESVLDKENKVDGNW